VATRKAAAAVTAAAAVEAAATVVAAAEAAAVADTTEIIDITVIHQRKTPSSRRSFFIFRLSVKYIHFSYLLEVAVFLSNIICKLLLQKLES
jgi:hypothetical protein